MWLSFPISLTVDFFGLSVLLAIAGKPFGERLDFVSAGGLL